MKLRNLAISASLSLFAAGAALASEDAESDPFVPEGYQLTGETESCLMARRIDNIDPVSDDTWLVHMRGSDTYLTRVGNGCRAANSAFTYLQYELHGSQLCRNEIVRVRDQGSDMIAGSCGLGDFEELVEIAEADS